MTLLSPCKAAAQISVEEATSRFQTSEYLKNPWSTLPLWKETLAQKNHTCTGAEVAVRTYGLLYTPVDLYEEGLRGFHLLHRRVRAHTSACVYEGLMDVTEYDCLEQSVC